LSRVIASPLDSGSLRVGLAPLFSYTTANWLDVLLLVDAHDVAVTHKLNGIHEAGLDFLLRVYGMNGEVLYDRGGSHSLPLTAEEYRRALDDGLNYTIRVPVPKPGVMQVRAVVCDATSSNTGIAHRLIEVPDVSTGELLLSGIVLETAASADAATAGTGVDSARRLFHAGEQIAYRCSIYNAAADSRKRVEVEVQTTMYTNGQVVYAGAPMPLAAEADGRQELNMLGKLKLGSNMVHSESVLEVTVTDKGTQDGKPRTASQWTDFTVR